MMLHIIISGVNVIRKNLAILLSIITFTLHLHSISFRDVSHLKYKQDYKPYSNLTIGDCSKHFAVQKFQRRYNGHHFANSQQD